MGGQRAGKAPNHTQENQPTYVATESVEEKRQKKNKKHAQRETQHQTQPSQVDLHLHQPKIIDNQTNSRRWRGRG